MIPKHKNFVIALLRDPKRIAGRAYAASYGIDYEKSTNVCDAGASRLLKIVKIANYIETMDDAEVARINKKLSVTKEKVLAELAAIGYSRLDQHMNYDGDQLTITPTDDLSPEDKIALKKITLKPGKYGDEVTVELHDKKAALDSLGKHLGIFKEKVELSADDDLRKFFELIDGRSRQPIHIGGNQKEAIEGEVVNEELADQSEVKDVDELLETNTKELKQEQKENVNI